MLRRLLEAAAQKLDMLHRQISSLHSVQHVKNCMINLLTYPYVEKIIIAVLSGIISRLFVESITHYLS